MKRVDVVGAGLAGSEAAYQLIKRGIPVDLYEQRPAKSTPVHHTGDFAELVCSNSLRSNDVYNAVGLLKQEMRQLDSLIIKTADDHALPAGSALAVDRLSFSAAITAYLSDHPLVRVIRQEYTKLTNRPTIIAGGPLISAALSQEIADLLDGQYLSFYDAVAPIVSFDSIDLNIAYYKSRYDKAPAAYLNCPLDKDQYLTFYQALITSATRSSKNYNEYFPGCLPIEVIASSGIDTLRYGPLKPVGLEHNGLRPYAVVQLRQDDYAGSLYNLVGFQTQLTWPRQREVLALIPGLQNCEIVRYGVMHRNTFIKSPGFLDHNYRYKDRPLFFAGQLTGVEGYVESAASGLIAGINMAKLINEESLLNLDNTTMIGALANYIAKADRDNFQPMNANYGIIKQPDKIKKSERKIACLAASNDSLHEIKRRI